MREPFLDILPKSTVNFDQVFLSTKGRSFNTTLPRNYNDSCLPCALPKILKFHLISCCGNCGFPPKFYTRILGEIPFFSAVVPYKKMQKSYIKIT